MEPLKAEWANAQVAAEAKRSEGNVKGAIAEVNAFHEKLCEIRILDPACGTGNFLYVSLELMKRLEGEVLEALASLSEQGRFTGYELRTIDPHQFLGLEVNPRAAAITELVLWIGHCNGISAHAAAFRQSRSCVISKQSKCATQSFRGTRRKWPATNLAARWSERTATAIGSKFGDTSTRNGQNGLRPIILSAIRLS
jgi:hypothetical protein